MAEESREICQERQQPARECRWKPQKRWIPATATDAKVATKEERSMLQA